MTLIANQPQVADQQQFTEQPETTPTQLPAGLDPEIENLLAMSTIQVTVTGQEGVNLRGGPGALYPIVARVDGGTKLAVIGVSEQGEWLVLRHPHLANRVAWVYRLFTNYDPERQKLPVIHNVQAAPTAAP